MRRRLFLSGGALPFLGACVSVDVGLSQEAPLQRQFVLQDAGLAAQTARPRRVAALLVQGLPSSAAAETLSMAYAPRADELAYYQFATWADRPVRRVPQLLVQRLEAAGLAAASGELGGPLMADWLLTLRVEHLAHDLAPKPAPDAGSGRNRNDSTAAAAGTAGGNGRVQLMAELYNRRQPGRVARQRFDASVPAASADSAAAALALSSALGRVFDALLPWLEAELPAPAA